MFGQGEGVFGQGEGLGVVSGQGGVFGQRGGVVRPPPLSSQEADQEANSLPPEQNDRHV